MNADSHSFALLASSDGRSWVNVAAWIGAGVFACVLLVLTRSRWGQAQPLTRCAILSIFAHLIFAVYAATVHVMFSPAPPPSRISA